MKKNEIVKRRQEFDQLIKNSRYSKNNFFVVYFNKKAEDFTRFGIAVGTKVGIAVIRNKLKRQVREIIKEEKSLFPKDKDYIIIVRKNCLNLNYHEMKENLIKLIK